MTALEDKKTIKEKSKEGMKRKLTLEETALVKTSRESTESWVATLNKDIVQLSFEAEEKNNLTHLRLMLHGKNGK